ncbi:MAG: hypothetical protein LBC64_08870 [Fibromonadaceae bacterium]|jgi:hypothetical protein|nr:hypothetical protein [Fibromonadaceae bacterium]
MRTKKETDLMFVSTFYWFDKLKSGSKKEEYRELKPFNENRVLNYVKRVPKDNWRIVFRRGYTGTTMTLELLDYEFYENPKAMRKGRFEMKPEWGFKPELGFGEGKKLIVFKLGKEIV